MRTNEHRARLSAVLGIGLGIIDLVMTVASPGSNWAAMLGGSALLVGIATLYRLRTQTETKEYEPL
jgi:membrane-bound ClpP family serine protease